jgi:hypothetical protein
MLVRIDQSRGDDAAARVDDLVVDTERVQLPLVDRSDLFDVPVGEQYVLAPPVCRCVDLPVSDKCQHLFLRGRFFGAFTRSETEFFPDLAFVVIVGPSVPEIEGVGLIEHVQADTVNAERKVRIGFIDVAERDLAAIEHVNRAGADHLEPPALDDDRAVLVDAEADDAWILRDSPEQPANAPPLGEVLIDYHSAQQTESGGHPKLRADAV